MDSDGCLVSPIIPAHAVPSELRPGASRNPNSEDGDGHAVTWDGARRECCSECLLSVEFMRTRGDVSAEPAFLWLLVPKCMMGHLRKKRDVILKNIGVILRLMVAVRFEAAQRRTFTRRTHTDARVVTRWPPPSEGQRTLSEQREEPPVPPLASSGVLAPCLS